MMLTNRSSQMSEWEYVRNAKIFGMSKPSPNSHLKQVILYFSLCYITFILLVQNILDPVNVVDNLSVN